MVEFENFEPTICNGIGNDECGLVDDPHTGNGRCDKCVAVAGAKRPRDRHLDIAVASKTPRTGSDSVGQGVAKAAMIAEIDYRLGACVFSEICRRCADRHVTRHEPASNHGRGLWSSGPYGEGTSVGVGKRGWIGEME